MKKIKPALLMLTVLVLAFSSCKKKDTKPKTAALNVSFKFNGTAYTSATPIAIYSLSQHALVLTGAFGTTSALSLAVTSGVQVGTFDIASGAAALIFTTGTTLSDSNLATTGSVVITTFTTTTVSGTFQATTTDLASNAGTITSGTFNANLVTQ